MTCPMPWLFQFVYQKRTYHLQWDGQQPGGSQVPPAPINAQSSASVFANHNRPPQSEEGNKFKQFVDQVPDSQHIYHYL